MIDPDTEDPDYYMVRAKDQTDEEFEFFFDNEVVAIGWSRVDVRELDTKEEVDEVVGKHYDFWDEAGPRLRGRRENEILRFNSIEEGDRVVVPYHSSIALATVTGEHQYEPEVVESIDLSNQVKVTYLREDGDIAAIPRDELTEGLARRLRVRGISVNELDEFAEEIEQLFRVDDYRWQARLEDEEEERREEFRADLLQNIRDGKTHLDAGGRGLEELVAELLDCEGYDEAETTGAFPGDADADVRATRADRFGEQKILVQVKHHQGTSGGHGVDQLIAIPKQAPEKYEDHKLVYLTTGDVKQEVRERAAKHDIDVLDGHEFADWLLDYVDEINPRMRRQLGISDLPQLSM